MKATDWTEFLQWALPRMRLSWKGFRNVRGQVCKRLARRMRELGLQSPTEYRAYLDMHPPEWERLRALCRVTITRFYRDRGVFRHLDENVFPRLSQLALQEERTVDVWCAGCAGGEEAYTVAIVWYLGSGARSGPSRLRVLATDIDDVELERARKGVYPAGALRELPAELRDAAFERRDADYEIKSTYRDLVEFRRSDLTEEMPKGPFDVVLCRNVAFTYFDEDSRRGIARDIARRMRRDGVLVLGKHETLPSIERGFVRLSRSEPIYGLLG